MKKLSTAAARKFQKSPTVTIGLDLGDRSSHYCVLDESGRILTESKTATSPTAMEEVFGKIARARVALETGVHSPWISRLLNGLGHEVIVGHARKVRLIGESRKKDDRLDAQTLARLARIDPQLLCPVKHRSAKAQADLSVIRARAGLVRARTALVNTARGLAKSYGERLRGCTVRHMTPRKSDALSPELQTALQPLLVAIEMLSDHIREYNERVEKLAEKKYPQVQLLKHGQGCGHVDRADVLADPGGSAPFSKEPRCGLLSRTAARAKKLGAERAADAHQQRRRSLLADVTGARSTAHLRAVRSRQ